MSIEREGPAELARRLAARGRAHKLTHPRSHAWKRETFRLPRVQAREKARDWFQQFPKAAYMTEIEFWRVCEDGDIEFTIRRLPTAD